MKFIKIIILSFFLTTVAYSQQKSQSSPIEFKGKSINSFTITLPQSMSFVSPLFESSFDLAQIEKNPSIESRFTTYYQVSMPKITSSQLDFYYNLSELKSDNGDYVTITLLVSKGYDNFISRDSDNSTAEKIMEILDEIGTSVERKNIEVQIAAKENFMQKEKEKLLFIEQELKSIENERKEIDARIFAKSKVLADQTKIAQDTGNELQKLRLALSDFEKRISNKSKTTLKVISKQ